MPEFLVSLAVTLVTAPGVRWLMLRQGVLDIPNHRSSHSRPTPRGGGLACLLGVLAALAFARLAGRELPWAVVAAAVVLSLLGYADDRADVSATLRLGAQVLAGAAIGLALGSAWLVLAGALVTPVAVNVVNFMDGINGITSLSATVFGVTAWTVGVARGVEGLWVVGAVTAGAALGFLPWNAPSARLFLGDAGSYLFGGLVAAGLLVGWAADALPLLLAAPLSLYLADTGVALVRRAHQGEPLMQAHRQHVYQRLTSDLGLPHLLVAALVSGLALVVTLAWATAPWWAAAGATALVCGLYLGAPRIIPGVGHRPAPTAGRPG